MKIDLKDKPIGEQIKFIARDRGYTLKTLSEELNDRYDTKYKQQSLSRKMGNNTFTYEELVKFGEVLGFKIELIPMD